MTKKGTKNSPTVIDMAALSDQSYSGVDGGYKGAGKFTEVALVSAKLSGNNKLTVKYRENSKTGLREHTIKCDHIAHDELVQSFNDMLFDLLNLCEQPEAVMVSFEDYKAPDGGVVYAINFNEMILGGEKLSEKSQGATLSLTTPRAYDTYERYDELAEMLNNANNEVKLYLNGKQRNEQSELAFEDEKHGIDE